MTELVRVCGAYRPAEERPVAVQNETSIWRTAPSMYEQGLGVAPFAERRAEDANRLYAILTELRTFARDLGIIVQCLDYSKVCPKSLVESFWSSCI